jgi:plasmid maintenance system antidote protein VapI
VNDQWRICFRWENGRIDEICAGKRAVTADTALRLARFFGTDAQSWMNLQAQYDLESAEIGLAERIETTGGISPARA